MADNNADIELLATLDESSSEAEILKTIKILNDKLKKNANAKIKLDTDFDVKSIEQEIERLRGILHSKGDININVGGNVDSKGIIVSVKNVINQAKQVASKIPIPVNFDLKKEKLINDIKILGQQNSKLFTDSNMAAKYNSLLDTANLATSNKELKGLRLQLSALRSEIKATNLSGLSLGETFKKTFKRATELFAGTGGVMLLSQQLREAWREALNLDKAYTDLIKVQDELSRGDYPEYLEQCNKKAQELAATQQGLIEGVTEFSKSGYDLTTSNKLSERSTILANVGDMNAPASAKAIISGVQAYDVIDGYDDVIGKADALIDKFNEIGNTASITTAEIAEGVEKVGAVFADSNTSVDEFIALLAAGNRQYQDADSLALGLRTAALRIRSCKVELQQMGEETEGVYTSASKLQEKISDLTNIDGKGGVKILEADQKTYRSIYDIFLDISKVYKDMSDVDQSALLELIAGTRRASAISATLNNMSEATEIYERSLNSVGSAQEEYDKYLESSEAALNKFKASMVETYQSVISGETVTGLLDCGNAALQFANSLNLVESTLKGFVAIAAVKGITKFSVALKASTLQASNFGKALQFASNVPEGNLSQRFGMLKNIATASKSLTEVQLKQVLSNKALSNEDRIRILRLNGMEKSLAQAKLAEYGLTQATNAQSTAQKAATINTFSFSAAIKGLSLNLKAAFMSNPIGISIMALGTVIGGVSAKVSEYKENIRETRQANIDAANSAKEEANTLQDLYIQYSTLNGITDKTSSQEEEFKRVVEDITKALGDKASALEGLTAGQEEYTKKLKEATKAELEGQYATAKIGAGSAKDALKEVAYSSWSGSKITVEKNERMTGIEEHVAALKEVEPILKKFEDIGANGIHWEPINWDKNSNDMNALLEYYYSLIEAREKLVTSDNADFLMTSDIYKDINTTINELSDSVETYTEQQYNALKLEYEWKNGIPQTKEEFDAMKDSILATSGAGEEFQQILKGYLTTDFSDLASGIQSVADAQQEVAEQATKSFTKSDMISSINELSEGFEELDKIFESISDKDPFDFKLLDDKNFKETFSGLESYADFVETISSNSDDIDACRASFGELVQEWITSKGVLDNVNESTAQLTISMLENMGVANAEELVMSSLADKTEALALQEQFYAEYGYEIANASQYRIDSFLNQAGASETARQYLFALISAEQVFNNQDLNTADKIAKLKELATAYGQTAIAARIANLEKANEDGHIPIDYDKELASLQNDINNAVNNVKIDYAGGNKSNKSGGGSSKDAWKEAYDKELKELEHLHEMQLISDEEYYNQRIALNEKYFGEASGKHEKYLDEYQKNEEDIAQGLKKMWEDYWNDYKDGLDRLSSYAEKVFQKQIDALEKQKDKSDDAYNKEIESIESAIKALEDKRDAEEEYWQDQIDAIQDEIDALQDANDERERAINLQKKMYELQRAMSQRSILQYSSEKGMHYVTNDKDITNARDEVEQAKFDITIANLQKQKEALEDKLDEITDKYDVQIEKLNLRKETIENNMDAENKRLQEQIDLLEEQKEKWTEVAENIEFALLGREMMEKYGSDVTQKILSGDVEFLNAFISDYERATGVIQELDDATLTDIMNMVSQFGTSAENMGGISTQLADNLGTISGSADNLTESASKVDMTKVNDGLSNVSSTAQTAQEQLGTATQKFNELTNEINNYTIPPLDSTNFVASLGIDGNGGVLGDLQTFINKFKELCESIPTIWNDSLGVLVNGGGEAGGAEVRGYDSLFKPLLDAMTTTKTAIDTKLEEYKLAWQKFNTDLGTIIGVGNGSQTGADGTDASGGKQAGGKEGSDKKEKKSEADTSSIVGTITAGGEAVIQSFDEIWIPGFETFRDNISTICEQVVQCMNEMAKDAIEAAIKTIEAVNAAAEATGGKTYEIPDSLKDWEGVTYVRPYADGTEKAKKGLAIVGEEKPEIIVDNDGNVLLAKEPSIMNMEGGETVYNGEATAKMINGKNIVPLTAENDPKMYDYIQKFNNYVGNAVAERSTPIVKRPDYVLGDETDDMKALRLNNQIMQEILQPISNVNRNVEMMASNISKINNNNSRQSVQFSTGDIIVQGVQNVDGFAKAVKTRFPNAMIQALNTTR